MEIFSEFEDNNSKKYKSIDKSSIEKLNNPELLAIFNAANTNNDDILEGNEISVFLNKSNNLDELCPNTTIEAFTQFLELTKYNETQTDYNITNNNKSKDETKDDTIDFIESEFTNGIKTFEGYDPGLISKGYNGIKEFLGHRLAKSRVARALYVKNETAHLLQKAKNNELTEEEYYGNIKETLFKIFPNIDEMSEDKKAVIKKNIDALSPKEVIRFQEKAILLPDRGSSDFKNKIRHFIKEFQNATSTKHTETFEKIQDVTSAIKQKEYYTINEPFTPDNPKKLVTFEEVFLRQYHKEYDSGNMQELIASRNMYLYARHNVERKNQVHQILDNEISLNEGNNRHGASEETDNISKERLNNAILRVLDIFGCDSEVEKIKVLKNITDANLVIKDGKLEYTQTTEFERRMTSSDLTQIAKEIVEFVDNRAVQDKTLQNAAVDLEYTYITVFGQESSDELVEAYISDNEGIVDFIKNSVNEAALGGIVIGLCVCPPVAFISGIVGTVGSVGVDAINESGKKVITEEKKQAMIQELATNSALFIAGMGAGKAGMAAKAALLSKQCPRLVACIADIGLDSTLSLLSDLVLTGQINLVGEGFSQIISLIAGHIKPKRISAQDRAPLNNPLFDNAVNHLAKTNPELYAKFQYLRSKNMLPNENDTSLTNIILNPRNAQFSKRYLEELELLADATKNGTKPIDSFIPKFDNISQGIKSRKAGEVFSIKNSNEIYIKDESGNAIKLDMDRDTYYKLFPPLIGAKTEQGAIGDCYFVSGVLDTAMSNPTAKINILKLFHQNGNKITIDMKTYRMSSKLSHQYPNYQKYFDELPEKYEFDLNNPPKSLIYNNGIEGAKGLKLLEVAFGYNRLIESITSDIVGGRYSNTEIENFISELNKFLANPSYKTNDSFNTILNRTLKTIDADENTQKTIRQNILKSGFDYAAYLKLNAGNGAYTLSKILKLPDNATSDINSIPKANELLSNPNYVIFASTDSKIDPEGFFANKISRIKKRAKYVAESHAYRIESIDTENRTISLINPWNTSKVITLSYEDFGFYFNSIRAVNLGTVKADTQNKYLASKLAQNGLSNKDKYGNYYTDEDMLVEYLYHIQSTKHIEFAETYKFKHPDKEWSKFEDEKEQLNERKDIQELQSKYNFEMAYGWDIAEMIAGFKEGTNTDNIIKAMSKFLDKISGTTKDYYIQYKAFTTMKSEADYVFTLEKAPEIIEKLKAKNFDEDSIIFLLNKISVSNYNELRHIWED